MDAGITHLLATLADECNAAKIKLVAVKDKLVATIGAKDELTKVKPERDSTTVEVVRVENELATVKSEIDVGMRELATVKNIFLHQMTF